MIRNFPSGYTPNDSQQFILPRLQEALESKKKFVIIQAPTGSGKSFISKTIGSYSRKSGGERNGCFVLTVTKALQDQYKETFIDTAILKGKSNYVCEINPQNYADTASCNFSPRIKKDCMDKCICPYYNARTKIREAQFSSLSYSMFVSLPEEGGYKPRHVIVCDEASELEDTVVDHHSLVLNMKKLDRLRFTFNHSSNRDDVLSNLNELRSQITERLETLAGVLKTGGNAAEKAEYIFCLRLEDKIRLVILSWSQCEYIIEDAGDEIKFTPLKIDTLTGCIFDYADKIVLMSATIIDYKRFARTLGIDSTDFEFIDVESGFDAERSPISVAQGFQLNYKTLPRMLPKIAEAVEMILENHPDEKGIIHTHTMQITKYLQDYFSGSSLGSRLLCRESGVVNEELVKMHFKAKKPTVIVSPSLSFGLDLKGDQGKFQIIVKLPYPPLGNKRIKKLADLDRDWYVNKMFTYLVQQCGRTTRAASDESHTYVLDSGLIWQLQQHKDRFPTHFMDRFV